MPNINRIKQLDEIKLKLNLLKNGPEVNLQGYEASATVSELFTSNVIILPVENFP